MNQIETTIAKVALGAGWPHGLAEEIGRAAAWLAARSFDGIGTALAGLSRGPIEADVDEGSEIWVFRGAKAAFAGPSAFDLLAVGVGLREVQLREVDQPLLLIGLGAIAAEAYGHAYQLRFSNGCSALTGRHGVIVDGALPSSGADARIEVATAKDDTVASVTVDIEVDDRLWQDALAMAAKSYVASSASSRALGAGAGLVDKD